MSNDSIRSKVDCKHLEFCSNLGITTNECKAGAKSARRCTQGQYAQIVLLSKLLELINHLNKETSDNT